MHTTIGLAIPYTYTNIYYTVPNTYLTHNIKSKHVYQQSDIIPHTYTSTGHTKPLIYRYAQYTLIQTHTNNGHTIPHTHTNVEHTISRKKPMAVLKNT